MNNLYARWLHHPSSTAYHYYECVTTITLGSCPPPSHPLPRPSPQPPPPPPSTPLPSTTPSPLPHQLHPIHSTPSLPPLSSPPPPLLPPPPPLHPPPFITASPVPSTPIPSTCAAARGYQSPPAVVTCRLSTNPPTHPPTILWSLQPVCPAVSLTCSYWPRQRLAAAGRITTCCYLAY